MANVKTTEASASAPASPQLSPFAQMMRNGLSPGQPNWFAPLPRDPFDVVASAIEHRGQK